MGVATQVYSGQQKNEESKRFMRQSDKILRSCTFLHVVFRFQGHAAGCGDEDAGGRREVPDAAGVRRRAAPVSQRCVAEHVAARHRHIRA